MPRPRSIKSILARLLSDTLDTATHLTETLLRRLRRLPPGAPVRMTPTQLAFDDYLRRRDGSIPRDSATLRAPGAPGLVSIVLPVFNGERYLPQAIDSILAQRYTLFELIIVDDGSTDATPAIIAEVAGRDHRIRTLRQANVRLPGALNAGFALARGEYLTWASDDNRMLPDFLGRMVAAFAADPGADMLYADYDLIGGDGRRIENSPVCDRLQEPAGSGHVHLIRDVSILNLINGNFIGMAFMYRARVMHLVGDYSPRRFTCEDYDFHLRVNEQLRLRHAPFAEILYEYRLHGASLTARKDDLGIDRQAEQLMAFDDFRRDFACHPLAWMIDFEPARETPAANLGRRLSQRAARAGDLLCPPGRWPAGPLPQVMFPAVYLHVAERLPAADFLAGRGFPAGTLKILLYAGPGPLPRQLAPEWDFCLAFSPRLAPVPLERHRQGWLVTGDFETLWAALGVRARADHAARVEEAIAAAAATPAPLQASVVISTVGRRDKLAAAVRSALRQTLDAARYEVIVVNNAPERGDPEDLVLLLESLRLEERPGRPDLLRLVNCPLRGMSIARNAGLFEARGGVVHFLDDDALADPALLETLLRAHEQNPACAVIGGAITLQEPDPWPSGLARRARAYWGHFEPPGPGLTLAEDWRQFPWGGNWSVKRDIFLQIGGFRCRYGRAGRQFNTGEEVVASLILQRLGYGIATHAGARVIHDPDPARFTLRNLARTIFETWDLALPLELDFYLPRQAHWPRLVWHGLKHLRHAAHALRHDRFEALENFLFAVAHARLALRQIALEGHRWRVPRTER